MPDPNNPPLRFGLKDLLIWAAVSGYLCGLIVLGQTSEIGPRIIGILARQNVLVGFYLLFFWGVFVAPLACLGLIVWTALRLQGPKAIILAHLGVNLACFLLLWVGGINDMILPILYTLSLGVPFLLPAAALQHWYACAPFTPSVARLYAVALLVNLLLIGFFAVLVAIMNV